MSKSNETKASGYITTAKIASRHYERLAARQRTAQTIAERNQFGSEMAEQLAIFDDCVRQLGLLNINAHDVICA